MNNLIYNQKGGTAIMMTVLMLTVILTITLAAADIVRNGLVMSQDQVNSTKAYFAAEAGAERILWDTRPRPPRLSFPFDNCTELSPGNIDQDMCFDADPGDIDACENDFSNCANEDKQTLSNGAIFQLNYKYDDTGSDATTTLSSLGTFGDIHRNVQLKYGH